MKYLFFIRAGIFDSDPINTGGVGGATTPPVPPVNDGLCADPGTGMPKYVTAVLNELLGGGTISREEYRAVVKGTKSIEDLVLTSAERARLRCDGTGEVQVYDPHFDPTLPPAIGALIAGLANEFMLGHKPTDKAHRIALMAGLQSVPAGASAVHVTFGTPYQDENGQLVEPNVLVSSARGTAVWRATGITPHGYDLISDSGLGVADVVVCQVVVEPVRR